MILNFDQTQVGSPNKTTYTGKGSKFVPTTNVDNKRQIIATFCVSLSREFLTFQLIYAILSDRCQPKVKLPNLFYVTNSKIHWPNKKSVFGIIAY